MIQGSVGVQPDGEKLFQDLSAVGDASELNLAGRRVDRDPHHVSCPDWTASGERNGDYPGVVDSKRAVEAAIWHIPDECYVVVLTAPAADASGHDPSRRPVHRETPDDAHGERGNIRNDEAVTAEILVERAIGVVPGDGK